MRAYLNKGVAVMLAALWSTVALGDVESVLEAVDQSIRHRNYQLAIERLESLLELNIAEAEYRMAGLYRSGRGVAMDLPRAMELYEKAAIQGFADAQYALASILEKQHPEEQGVGQSMQWYRAAAELGHPMAIARLDDLRKGHHADDRDPLGRREIFDAIRNNDLRQIRALVTSGARLDMVDDEQRSTLLAALYAGHHEMARLLLPHAGYPDKADSSGNRPIHLAVRNGYEDIVSELMRKKVDMNARDHLGNTALMIATRHDNAGMMRLLLANNADHRVRNHKKQSAPQLAQISNLSGARSVFRELGIRLPDANPDYVEVDIGTLQQSTRESSSLYKGWPPLSVAALLGEVGIVEQLLARGAPVDARDTEGNTPLHRAASKGRVKSMEILIANGCNVNAVNKANETALYFAARAGQLNTVRLLLKYGADISIVADDKTSALSVAISNGHNLSAGELLDGPLDRVSIHNALMLAIQNGMEELALRILERDSRYNTLDDKMRSALWYSADLGQQKLAATLLRKKGMRIDQADSNGYTPLARAVGRGFPGMVRLLVAGGANVNVVTREKNTLLMLSVESGNPEITGMLLARGVDVNARNALGNTALMLAAANGFDRTVALLLDAEADAQLRNLDDQNAYDIAINAGHSQIAELIRERSNIVFKLFN